MNLDDLLKGGDLQLDQVFDEAEFYLYDGGWYRLCKGLLPNGENKKPVEGTRWLDQDAWPEKFDVRLQSYLRRYKKSITESIIWDEDDKFRWMHSILVCARIIANKRSYFSSTREFPGPLLKPLVEAADKLGVPHGFMLDVAHAYLFKDEVRRPPTPAFTLTTQVLLIKGVEGVVGDLSVSLMPDGSGELYPDYRQACVWLDQDFGKGIENSLDYLKNVQGELWPKEQDVRWQIKLRDNNTTSRITGGSAGAAFAMAIEQILTAAPKLG